jgi:hypothetical protein
MKKQEFSEESLKKIRDTLPYGAQEQIAQKLSTPDIPISLKDVIRALHGKGLRYPKCDPSVIIMEAIAICKSVKISQQEAKQSAEELLNSY